MRRLLLVATVLLALAGTTGCQGSGHGAGSGDSADAATTTPSGQTTSPTPMLTPTAAPDTPLGAGQRIWAAFSERGLAQAAWWSQLKPLLSEAARAQYVYDDPANLPAMQLTGDLTLTAKPPARPGYTAEVVVPTSKGTFRLDLERHTKTSPWLLYGMEFPSGVQ